MYLTNKIVSVLLCFGFAIYTLSFKRTFYQYRNVYPDAENVSYYAFIYWLLFIYFSFHGIDELLELYAVYFKREKGALGLLFEMNYFLGFGIMIYIMWFVKQPMSAIADPAYASLLDFVNNQVVLFYISIAVSLFMTGCFWKINSGVTKKNVTKDEFIAAN